MPYHIKISHEVLARILEVQARGIAAIVTMHVDWPELKLTEPQKVSNELARAGGNEAPYEDKSFIQIDFMRPGRPDL